MSTHNMTEAELLKLKNRLSDKLNAVWVSLKDNQMLEQLRIHKTTIEIPEVEAALKRLELGTIGVCERCDEAISFKRLMHRPETRFCVSCLSDLEKSDQERAS